MSENCPTCGQPWPAKGKRLCSLCKQPIGRDQKWRFGPDSRPEHRICRESFDQEPTKPTEPTMALFTTEESR